MQQARADCKKTVETHLLDHAEVEDHVAYVLAAAHVGLVDGHHVLPQLLRREEEHKALRDVQTPTHARSHSKPQY
eukprot:COSAG05_NODE_11224_length_524_cov_0.896471_2_plen_75_part_00